VVGFAATRRYNHAGVAVAREYHLAPARFARGDAISDEPGVVVQ
jgi:hypothetical protein